MICRPQRPGSLDLLHQGQSALTERINTTLSVRAPPLPKAKTSHVRPGRYIIKFKDLNRQNKEKGNAIK
jgi:hypothetical protein